MHRLFSARCLILGTVLVASVQAHGQTDKPNAVPDEAPIKYKVCYGPERPTGFKTKPNSCQRLYVLERQKPKGESREFQAVACLGEGWRVMGGG